VDIEHLWFQQGGTTCHTSCETVTLIQVKFLRQVISLHCVKNGLPGPVRTLYETPLIIILKII